MFSELTNIFQTRKSFVTSFTTPIGHVQVSDRRRHCWLRRRLRPVGWPPRLRPSRSRLVPAKQPAARPKVGWFLQLNACRDSRDAVLGGVGAVGGQARCRCGRGQSGGTMTVQIQLVTCTQLGCTGERAC